jgi:hypothetical protein
MKKGQSRGTGNTGHTSRRKNKTKTQHNMRWTPPYASKPKQYICPPTKNWDKDEPNIAFMREKYHQTLTCKRKRSRLSLLLLLSPL